MALVCCINRDHRSRLARLNRKHSGRVRLGYVALVAIIAGGAAIAVLSDRFGKQSEQAYRDTIHQLADDGIDITISSYERGWFSSEATAIAQFGQRRLTLRQHISHGPLTLAGGLRPVAAVIETAIEAPPEYAAPLRGMFGDVSPRIHTVVTFDGAFDTFISLPPSTIAAPLPGCVVRSGGLSYEWYLSPDVHRLSGQGPTFTSTGGCPQIELAGVTASSESHLEGGHRVGGSHLSIERIEGLTRGPVGQIAWHGLIRDLSLSGGNALKNGRMNINWKVSVGNVAAGGLQMRPAELSTELSNLDSDKLAAFATEVLEINKSKLGKDAQERLLGEKAHAFLVGIVRQPPGLALTLHVVSPDGASVGRAKMGLAAGFADDSRFVRLKQTDPDEKQVMKQLIQQYGYASGDVSIPQSFAARIVSADKLRTSEESGVLKRDGANYVSHFSYQGGELIVNGKKFQPTPARPSTPTD
jgi:uncharacterized protein YdgA (DUF945 family)